jgi:ADP-ribose pyrophosphatase YjhB (NUDIX family)
MRVVINLLYHVRRRTLALLRLRTRGVKVMVFNPRGELVLIRNSYGRSDLFVLPGGGIRPFEQPAKAAVREIREEIGLDLDQLTLVSTHVSTTEGKRDMIYLYKATATGLPQVGGVEVAEVGFFELDRVPPTTSSATRRRIAEYRGIAPASAHW